MHIAIAGNIGAGKTSLTELIAKHYNWEANFEDVIDNPYLDDFYNHMERWSFNLQVYFLKSRFQQLLLFKDNKKTIVQDRTIYEDAHIFAPNLNAMGLMNQRDFKNYQQLFDLVESLIEGPDLLIYLRSSVEWKMCCVERPKQTLFAPVIQLGQCLDMAWLALSIN